MESSANPEQSGSVQGPSAVPRLEFVEGLRGVAAVVVMMGHLAFTAPAMRVPPLGDSGVGDLLLVPFRFSGEMVLLFLMVSGFSLHYSEVTRRAKGRAATTLRQFAARRVWRIAPVYYVAAVFGLLVVLAVRSSLVLRPEDVVSLHLTANGVLAHLFFVHNLNSDWLYQVNGPLWSIAYEMQLYLLFPLVFMAMRRLNPVLVAVVLLAVLSAIGQLHLSFPVFGLARWFLLGMLLAEAHRRGWRLPTWLCLAVGLSALLVGMAQLGALSGELPHDAVWGIAFAALMFAAFNHPGGRSNPMAWRVTRWVGLRSYSLYALHYPLLLILLLVAQKLHWSGWSAGLFCIFVGAPLSLLLSAVAFRFVERPSLRRAAQIGR